MCAGERATKSDDPTLMRVSHGPDPRYAVEVAAARQQLTHKLKKDSKCTDQGATNTAI